MVTFFVFVFILVDTVFVAFFIFLSILFTVVIRLEATFLLVVGLSAEPCFCLPHLAELFVTGFFIIFENLVFLVFLVLILDLLNNSFGLFLPLAVLQVVSVQLVL